MGRGTVLALAIAAPVAALVVLFVVLGSSGDTSDQARAAPPPALRVAKTRLGRVLVDQRGLTLYLFLQDKHHRSTCYGGCARVWPAAIAHGAPHVGAGLERRRLTTTKRRDGTRQLVYAGHPLYRMVGDTRPGQTEGQAFLGTWFVVAPTGHLIGHPKRGGPAY